MLNTLEWVISIAWNNEACSVSNHCPIVKFKVNPGADEYVCSSLRLSIPGTPKIPRMDIGSDTYEVR